MIFGKKSSSVREEEGISIRNLAQRFRVAKSFIQKLLKQYEETGNLEPQPLTFPDLIPSLPSTMKATLLLLVSLIMALNLY